jgi:hypothetical protein
MRASIILVFGLLPLLAEAQIFKCTEADGSKSFSNVPCKSETGQSESIKVQVNEVGTFATQADIEQFREEAAAPPARSQVKVTVVTDSATEDQSTLDGIVNRRLRLKEEALERERGPNTSGVTVIVDRSNEGQIDKAYRLKKEAAELGRSSPKTAPESADDYHPLEINSREVPYVAGQSEDKRYLQQIQNKMNDPRAADSSTSSCVDGKPSRGVVKVRGKEIWPGMASHQVRRLIGSPDSLNSLLVGHEQWAYRTRSGGTTYVRIVGRCVSSIE